MLYTTAIPLLEKVLSHLYVVIICMLYCETVSIKVSRAIFLSGQTFAQTVNLEFFSEQLVEESGNDIIVCHRGKGSCTLPLKSFPEKE